MNTKKCILREELSKELDDLLQCRLFKDYCPNGLQVEGALELDKLAFAVSADLKTIVSAKEWGAKGLIVHHGLFWKNSGQIRLTGPLGNRVKELYSQDMNLWGFHLPLDAHLQVGNAAYIGQLLGMKKVESFFGDDPFPLGIKGEIEITASELQKRLEIICHHNVIMNAPQAGLPIQTIGIVTGGASNGFYWAKRDGLDAYITGEMKENSWHDSQELGVTMFACGHHASERGGVLALQKFLQLQYPGIEMKFFDSINLA